MEAAFRKVVFNGLRAIVGGHIQVVDETGRNGFGDVESDLTATLEVHDNRFYGAVALDGGMGAAEAYRLGYWSSPQLVPLMRIFSRNLDRTRQLDGIARWLLAVGRKLSHRGNRNSKAGSRRNIAAHYDLSNDFYALFLDETMTYSSGYFPSSQSSLREASVEKYDRICRRLQLSAADHVLEIGTGWGGFATHAVENYGCRVTTTTISRAQHDYAERKFASRGTDRRVELLFCDYRDLTGKYDKLVSIEMIEAVGHQFFDTFFAKCSDLLRPGGAMSLQAITIPDQRYERYRKSVDFIQRYIFPGGCLPSIGAMAASVGRATDLQLAQMEDFAEHYARTLGCWRQRFNENLDAIRDLGMSEPFLRLWEYYLCYCEAGFREQQIGVSQFLFRKCAH